MDSCQMADRHLRVSAGMFGNAEETPVGADCTPESNARWQESPDGGSAWEANSTVATVSAGIAGREQIAGASISSIEYMSIQSAHAQQGVPTRVVMAAAGAAVADVGGQRHLQRHRSPKVTRMWTPEELQAATGNPSSSWLQHGLALRSAYLQAENEDGAGVQSEPDVTSFHESFCGTVDYIWHSPGLRALRVLATEPAHVLKQQSRGLPSHRWPSDHLPIACDLVPLAGRE
eukprot:TRINITY_DN5942_c1_g3_i1.p1 TRINITY_DN5942_c1_g3~~TRINITY_DN5942_c1_g3_i1.p1  ORF type:complete len:232 (-),score=35.93 TRINITY_DN5942_c1_g3_i1:374-1069(-)